MTLWDKQVHEIMNSLYFLDTFSVFYRDICDYVTVLPYNVRRLSLSTSGLD